MALVQYWRVCPRCVDELPKEVKEAKRYAKERWIIKVAYLSVCGNWLQLKFVSGLIDYWVLTDSGWKRTLALPPWEEDDLSEDVLLVDPDIGGEG